MKNQLNGTGRNGQSTKVVPLNGETKPTPEALQTPEPQGATFGPEALEALRNEELLKSKLKKIEELHKLQKGYQGLEGTLMNLENFKFGAENTSYTTYSIVITDSERNKFETSNKFLCEELSNHLLILIKNKMKEESKKIADFAIGSF
ncbi:hypothetical protein [Emticicia fontis]